VLIVDVLRGFAFTPNLDTGGQLFPFNAVNPRATKFFGAF